MLSRMTKLNATFKYASTSIDRMTGFVIIFCRENMKNMKNMTRMHRIDRKKEQNLLRTCPVTRTNGVL